MIIKDTIKAILIVPVIAILLNAIPTFAFAQTDNSGSSGSTDNSGSGSTDNSGSSSTGSTDNSGSSGSGSTDNGGSSGITDNSGSSTATTPPSQPSTPTCPDGSQPDSNGKCPQKTATPENPIVTQAKSLACHAAATKGGALVGGIVGGAIGTIALPGIGTIGGAHHGAIAGAGAANLLCK